MTQQFGALSWLRSLHLRQQCSERVLGRDGFERGPAGDRSQGMVGATRARASGGARQPDAARHAAIHAGRAGNRDGALFGSRHPARPWRGLLGNGRRISRKTSVLSARPEDLPPRKPV
jgi:hypothetical protein